MSRRPFTIAILSGKGGVGKTTICLNLARRLSESYPVWLVDTDLFNRGTTSALWESESSIPLSVAELILKLTAPPGGAMEPEPRSPGDHVRILSEQIRSCWPHLTYTNNLFALPAARASEGREASYLLWRGVNERGLSAEDFLAALLEALDRITPGSIVLLDGHGGLDELSIAASIVSDVTYIVNEPDLITFTGSITLYQEISRACEARHVEPRIEFIINRVPPNKSVLKMERDFGDVLRTISPAREPVAAYFPLEPELFGVFGDDPFVSEIYTEYWFSRKIRLIARQLIEYGVLGQWLKPVTGDPLKPERRESDVAIRTALRREFHKRGGHLLTAWLVFLIAAETTFFQALLRGSLSSGFENTSFLPGIEALIALALIGLVFVLKTRRWFRVQIVHLRNSRRVRATRGRRLRLGDSESARLREAIEVKAKEKTVRRGVRTALVTTGVVAVVLALLIPNFLDALQKAKQRRAVGDIRLVGTAMFSWLTDQVAAAAASQSDSFPSFPNPGSRYNVEAVPVMEPARLEELLVPQYLQTLPLLDPWGRSYEYRLDEKNYLAQQVMVIRSRGRDGRFEGTLYPMGVFEPTDYSQDIVWADGTFVREPARQSGAASALQRGGRWPGDQRVRRIVARLNSSYGKAFSTSPASSPARRACSTP